MAKIAATIVMTILPDHTTRESFEEICENAIQTLETYTERKNIHMAILSLYADTINNTVNGRFSFETKKDYNQFIKGYAPRKKDIFSCFEYEVIENEKINRIKTR